MADNNKLITVYIPTYNRLKFLKRAVNSVLSQSYQNFELIIVDDCSQDKTVEYLKKLSSNDERIFFFKILKIKGLVLQEIKQ